MLAVPVTVDHPVRKPVPARLRRRPTWLLLPQPQLQCGPVLVRTGKLPEPALDRRSARRIHVGRLGVQCDFMVLH